jgi:hypothetical protein
LKAKQARKWKGLRLAPGPRLAKRWRGALSLGLEGQGSSIEDEGDGDNDSGKLALDLLLMYNSI